MKKQNIFSFKKTLCCLLSVAMSVILITNFAYATFDIGEISEDDIKISSELIREFDINEENLVMIYTSEEPKRDAMNVLDITYDEELLTDSSSLKKVQDFVETKRSSSRNIYLSLNNNYVNKYLDGYDIVYVSKYSPVIIAKVNYNQVQSISKKKFC